MLISAPLSMSACICLAFPCISLCQHGHRNGACQPLSNLQVEISSPIMFQNSPKDTQPTTHTMPTTPTMSRHRVDRVGKHHCLPESHQPQGQLERPFSFALTSAGGLFKLPRNPRRSTKLWRNKWKTGLKENTPKCSRCRGVSVSNPVMLECWRIQLKERRFVLLFWEPLATSHPEDSQLHSHWLIGDVVVESKSNRPFLLITSHRKLLQRSRCGQLKKTHSSTTEINKIVLDQAVALNRIIGKQT